MWNPDSTPSHASIWLHRCVTARWIDCAQWEGQPKGHWWSQTGGHGGWGWGVNIQLSSLNFETVTRGELSQLADDCLTLKISASTWTGEAALCSTETILSLMQMAGRFLQLGSPFFLSRCFMLLIPCKKQPNCQDFGKRFPRCPLSEKTHLYCTVCFYTFSEM